MRHFDPQGLANTAWAFASLAVPHPPLMDAIAAAALASIDAAAGAPGAAAAHRLALSILALAWAFAFLPPFPPVLRAGLWARLARLGRRLDRAAAGAPGGVARPWVLLRARGLLVLLKPPGWEVDV